VDLYSQWIASANDTTWKRRALSKPMGVLKNNWGIHQKRRGQVLKIPGAKYADSGI
jgi:hypothetical protein